MDPVGLTWNMQGGGTSATPQAKWRALEHFLFEDPTLANAGKEVVAVALQECGIITKEHDRLIFLRSFQIDGGMDLDDEAAIDLYYWRPPHDDASSGSGSSEDDASSSDGPFVQVDEDTSLDDETLEGGYYLTYVQFDYGKGPSSRVNLALLTKQRPLDAKLTFAEWRSALGVNLGSTDPHSGSSWIFSLHASANHGWDAEQLLANVCAATGRGMPWAVMGDFNKEPGDMAMRGEVLAQETHASNLHLVHTGQKTHNRSGPLRRELDYGCFTGNFAVFEMANASRHDFGLSDHFAVIFHD
ncbi:MAG: hypothetical protein AAF141_10435 [Pseudomonadota bacterium]